MMKTLKNFMLAFAVFFLVTPTSQMFSNDWTEEESDDWTEEEGDASDSFDVEETRGASQEGAEEGASSPGDGENSEGESTRLSNISLTADTISDRDIVSLLSKVVRKPLLTTTYIPRTRDPLFLLPLTRLAVADMPGFHFANFFNKNFRVSVPTVNTLNLDINTDLIETLISAAASAGYISEDQELIKLLPLLEHLNLEERKAGMMLLWNFTWGPFLCSIDSAVLMSERNLFADQSVQDEVRRIVQQAIGKPLSETFEFDEVREFARIKVGIGDTRFRMRFTPINRPSLKMHVGAGVILPTGGGMLLDGRFRTPKATEVNNFIDPLINNVRRIILTPDLGNNGHYGSEFSLDTDVPLYKNIFGTRLHLAYNAFSTSRISLKHITTTKQRRFLMRRTTIKPQDVEREPSKNIDSITTKFRQEYLIPDQLNARVHPGNIFRATSMLYWHWHNWRLRSGYDFYQQEREVFQQLDEANLLAHDVRFEDATAPMFRQHKLALEFGYLKHTTGRNYEFVAGGDYSVSSLNVGNDWTLYGRVSIGF